MTNLKPGDWVVMGEPGSGWTLNEKGLVAQVKEVGHFSYDYDIVLDSASNPGLIGTQCAGEVSGLKGCTSERLYTASRVQIEEQLSRLPGTFHYALRIIKQEIGLCVT